MAVLSINTWSLEKSLGNLNWTEWDEDKQEPVSMTEERPEDITLLELPSLLDKKGFPAVELMYAHLQDTSDDYLEQVRQAFEKADVEISSILLDYGDISHVDPRRRLKDTEWCKQWIDIAAKAGAKRVRITPGESPAENELALDRAFEVLQELAEYAEASGVRIVIENLGELGSTATNCLSLLGRSDNRIGFTADYGNFKTDKYRQLSYVLPRAETIHAKAEVLDNGELDVEDFRQCMELAVNSEFDGVYSVVYQGEGDVWGRIEQIRDLIRQYGKL